MVLGIVLNLATLGYFKYANFFVDNLNAVAGFDLFLGKVVLPIGISFFTFQKVAFLVDAYRGKVDRLNFIDYALFVTFFPQLIAGPIVHHSEVIRQFREQATVSMPTIALGITIFTIGLAKKSGVSRHRRALRLPPLRRCRRRRPSRRAGRVGRSVGLHGAALLRLLRLL